MAPTQVRIATAIALREAGAPILALEGKIPVEKGWTSIRVDQQTDEEVVAIAVRGNIGMPTGKASGRVVLDIDSTDVDRIQREMGIEHVVTQEVVTGRGGRQLHFAAPSVSLKNTVKVLHAEVDTRGEGGQVVLPGSIHPHTGRAYEWAAGRSPADVALAPVPTSLLKLWILTQVKEAPGIATVTDGDAVANVEALDPVKRARVKAYVLATLASIAEELSRTKEGSRNQKLFSGACRCFELANSGLLDGDEVAATLTEAAKTAGLEAEEIASVLHSAAKTVSGKGADVGKQLDASDAAAAKTIGAYKRKKLDRRPDDSAADALVETIDSNNRMVLTAGARSLRGKLSEAWGAIVFEHRPLADLPLADLCRELVAECRMAEQPMELAYAFARRAAVERAEECWQLVSDAWNQAVEARPIEYRTNEDGKPLNIRPNWSAALHNRGVRVWRDLFSGRDMVDGLEALDLGPELTDDAERQMRFLVDAEIKAEPPADRFHEFVSYECWQNRRHPVREYLDSLKWDGTPRLSRLLSRYFGAENTELHAEFGRLHLCAAVKRVFEPGAKYDEVLVLEGAQGVRKSTGIQALCPRAYWFLDDLALGIDAKVVIEQTRGKLFIELAELTGMHRRDVEKVKAMVSRQADRARAAYGRRAEDTPRQFVFWGSTNDGEYLRDQSGNRRFWPVRIGTIDVEAIRRDRDQLWAEAAELVRKGASIRLDPRFYEIAGEAQEERTVEDPIYARLAEVLSPLDGVEHYLIPADDLWAILDIPIERRDMKARDFGEACKRLGLVKKQMSVGGKRTYFRVRGEPSKAIAFRWRGGRLGKAPAERTANR